MDRFARRRVAVAVSVALVASLGASARADEEVGRELEALASSGAAASLARDVEQFYAARSGHAAWLRDGAATAQASAIAAILSDAGRKGLDPDDYANAASRGGLAAAEASGRRRADVELTLSALRYLSDLRHGRVDPRRLGMRLQDTAREPLWPVLQRIAAGADAGEEVATVEPPFAAYRRTVEALGRYQVLARTVPAATFPPPRRAVVEGDRYALAPALRRLLCAVGDLPEQDATETDLFDGSLARAVARFQRRHGLASTGRLDAATAARLSVPLAARATQLAVTVERWRWLPRRFISPPVFVNIPEFRLYADAGRITMRVAVGRAWRWRTPVFAGELRRVIFRPYWNVPASIQRDELVPRLARDPAELGREGYEMIGRDGRPIGPELGPGELERLRAGELRLRQRPGPRNALGPVKFDLPNAHGVYLHGTPAREVFGRPRRDVTHGCIRVEDPEALAAWVLRNEAGWDSATIAKAIGGSETRVVELAQPSPVFILYGTALVDTDGEVRFLDDVYGLDRTLERALDHQRRTRPVSTWTNAGPG